MTDLHELVKEIIEDLRKHQGSSPSSRRDGDPFPRIIDAGDGRQIHVSRNVDELIADIARQMMARDSTLKSRFSAKDFTWLVRRDFGPALAKIDLDQDVDQSAELVLGDVEDAVAKDINWTLRNGELEYSFGCTLFSYDDIAPFDIGPVRFEPRKVWLDRKASDGRWARVGPGGRIERFSEKIADGPISSITHRRAIQKWQGKKLNKRKASADAHDEKFILEAIGGGKYVCSVNVPGFGGDAGQHKAVLAARLAQATVSLVWENSSMALDGINLLAERRKQHGITLAFTSEGLMLANSLGSKRPHAPWLKKEELEESISRFSDCFTIAGEAIGSYLDPENIGRPILMNALAHSLLWFYEGCRETVDQIAIVKFAAAMEVLTGKLSRNGSQAAIRKLIGSCFGIDENAVITRDGKSVKQVVELIYKLGRTRMVHGENETIGHDWSIERAIAEKLSRYCLVIYLQRASENPMIDDPVQLLRQDDG